jgi:hypothetical protein
LGFSFPRALHKRTLVMKQTSKDRCANSETGTGFARAKLSEILPAARVARFVRMTERASASENFLLDSERLPLLYWRFAHPAI